MTKKEALKLKKGDKVIVHPSDGNSEIDIFKGEIEEYGGDILIYLKNYGFAVIKRCEKYHKPIQFISKKTNNMIKNNKLQIHYIGSYLHVKLANSKFPSEAIMMFNNSFLLEWRLKRVLKELVKKEKLYQKYFTA